ncbi:symplekin [Metschnikowia aff. pulcherrima]|uniref:Symplekin n=1 Tax=Metschnikowia aff. pulcherrima TaxID=2163413 RepID=A0A4P6XSA1_9ASCO|nr:symplekin [Metschnikowia aff. pulcherrima]
MNDETKNIIAQLDKARELGLSDENLFPQVVKQILNLVSNPNLAVQAWCAKFLKEAFTKNDHYVSPAVKVDLAIDALPHLKVLASVRDLEVFKNVIDVSVIVFKLAFKFVAENDGSTNVWAGVNELKNNLVAKYDTQFPFELSFDREHDAFRNIDGKLELLKFVMTVIDYQLRSNSNKYYSLARVAPQHTLIKAPLMESEAAALLDVVLKTLKNDILITPLVTATFNHLSVLVRRKRQFVDTIIPVLEAFDSTTKLQSNYEPVESFKLSSKYVDRTLRVLFNYMSKLQLIPPKFQGAIGRKLAILTARGDEIRRKNIVLESAADASIKKRKFEGFVTTSKKLKTVDYKNLYCLTDINQELNNFDFSSIPQNILVSMALTALTRASTLKLAKALEIISARYTNAIKDLAAVDPEVKKELKLDEDDTSETREMDYNPETTYTLPAPKTLSFQQKKEHVNLIVKNFFELANKKDGTAEAARDETGNSELTKVAIKTWREDSWLVLLTRLATRGMHTIDSKDKESADIKNNEQLSDIIRKALFDYFLANIHERIDLVIEWLNEEWYNEKVMNEQVVREEVTQRLTALYKSNPYLISDLEQSIRDEVEKTEIGTPVYDLWGQRVVDAMIPFLEPTDRKVFLRLLSDLPSLNREMIDGIKSLCADPARSKLGFLALQFLIMYRPPVKPACLDVLRDLCSGDQEDLKAEAQTLLKKYE